MTSPSPISPLERVNILHLSDLHFGRKDKASQSIIVEYFLDDLRRLADSEWHPNFVIFSGDIVNDPDNVSYGEVIGSLFLPIMGILNISTEHYAFCPGNHDVSRKYLIENADLHRGYLGIHNDVSLGLRHLDTNINHEYFIRKCFQFFAFLKEFGIEPTNPYFWSVPIPGSTLSTLSINSVLYSSAGLNGTSDNQHLYFPIAALDDALKRKEKLKTIAVMHHPLEWLNERCRPDIDLLIQNRSDFLLFGHVHAAAPSFRKGTSGQAIYLQSGALYDYRNFYNGYSVISIDCKTLNSKTLYRTYYPLRMEFDDGTNVAPSGIYYPLDASKGWWHNYSRRITDKKMFDIIKESALKKLDAVLNQGLDDRPLKQYFTPFPIVAAGAAKKKDSSIDAEAEPIAFDDIAFGTKNYAIVIQGEFGQTTYAKQLAYRYLLECPPDAFIRVPVIIDAARTELYDAAIDRAIKHFLSEVDRGDIKTEDLLSEGRILFIFENMTVDETKLSRLSNFIKSHAKNRFIIFVRSEIWNENFSLSFDKTIQLEHLMAQPLRRGDVRRLIEAFKPKTALTVDQLVDDVCHRLDYVGIVRSPWIVVAYLFIIERFQDFSPINLASMIENLIDVLLDKQKSIVVLRSDFDYNNKIDYLSTLAEYMARTNEYTLTYEKFFEVSSQYFLRIGLRQNIPDIVKYFIETRLLSQSGNSISFNYPSFFAYFAAKKMVSDPEFRKFMTTEDCCGRFLLELDFYTSMHRSDAQIAGKLIEYYEEAETKFIKEVYHLVREDLLHNLRVPNEKDSKKLFEGVFGQLEKDVPAPQERDEYLEQGPALRFSKKVSRPEVKDTFLRWIVFLRLLSRAAKNLELIDHSEKLRLLSICFRGWARLLLFALYILEELYVEGEIKIGNIKVVLSRPENMKEPTFLRYMLFLAPVLVSEAVKQELGTEKLEIQLKEIPFGPREVSEEFLRGVLYGDLRLPDKLQQLKRTVDRVKTAPFLLEAFVLRLHEMFFRLDDRDKGSVIAFQRFAAEVKAILDGGGERSVEREIQKLEVQKNLQKLKPEKRDGLED
jgi:hypothetical protein